MAKYISCGKYNNYYKYILLTILFSLLSTSLFGNGYCNDSNLIFIAQLYPDKTKTTQLNLSHHIIFHNIYRNFFIIIISIILYNYEKYSSKSEKNEESAKQTGIELIYEDLEKELEQKSILNIIFIIILFNIQDILTMFYFQFDLSQFNLWILELPLFSFFNYKILNIKIYSHHKFAMYLSVIVCLLQRIINFFVIGFSDDYKEEIYNKYKFLYLIGIISYLIIITIRSYTVVKMKIFMDLRYISPTKLLIINGVIGILINIIIAFIFTYNKCATVKDIDIHLCNIVEDNSNRDEAYLENFFIYLKILNNSEYYDIIIEVFTSLIGSFLYSFYIYFYIQILNYLSTIHMIFYSFIYAFCVQVIYTFISLLTDIYPTKQKFNVVIFIFTLIADIFAGFGICVYCEIFELNFCNFNYNLRRNIIKRGEEDVNVNRKTENVYNIIDEEKDDESENDNPKNMSLELTSNN